MNIEYRIMNSDLNKPSLLDIRYSKFVILFLCFLITISHAQLTFEQKDSGWVALFNGEDLTGFQAKFGTNEYGVDPNGTFTVVDGVIDVAGVGAGSGQIVTERHDYHHYHARLVYKFPDDASGNPNAGFLHHAQPDLPLYNGKWVQSVECQGQINTSGELWAIGVVLNSTVDGSKKYMEGGEDYFADGSSLTDHGGRNVGPAVQGYVRGEWNTLEVHSWGYDSVMHVINQEIAFKGFRVRVEEDDTDPAKRYSHGALAFQSEGAHVQYQNIHIMEKDPVTGEPLRPWGCTDSTYEEYRPEATLHDNEFCVNEITNISRNKAPQIEFTFDGNSLQLSTPSGPVKRWALHNITGKKAEMTGSGVYFIRYHWKGQNYIDKILMMNNGVRRLSFIR